jgi:hypothetical protein
VSEPRRASGSLKIGRIVVASVLAVTLIATVLTLTVMSYRSALVAHGFS